LRFILTGGQRNDCTQALQLLENFRAEAVPADKGYDADYIVQAAENMKAIAVIPPKANRKIQREYDSELYKERNLVERLFNKLKHFRRVATRYDKTAGAFLAFIHIASICLWLK
jgi:transposase